METRELTYFVAVAEERHFGRAAERLGIAQPPLSRAIQRLERRLDVTLMERTSRGVVLTGAGDVLLREARAALDAVDAAERRTRRAADAGSRGGAEVVLVTKAGAAAELLGKLLDAYAAEPGAVAVEVLLCGVGEQERMLRDGRADIAVLHRPFDEVVGLEHEALGTEGQVAVVPSGHPLSQRRELRLRDLQPVPGLPPPRWPRRDGTYAEGPGPEVHDSSQLLQLIGLGRTWAVMPESVRTLLAEDVTAVPVTDAEPVTTVIAWPPHSRSRAVAGLVAAATSLWPPSA